MTAPTLPAFRRFTELPDNPHRLGRHQVHDALDPARDARHLALDELLPIKTVTHTEFLPVFDQGQIGSCTANAALGCLATDPYGHAGVKLTEEDAVQLYVLETRIDDSQIPGRYPAQDTGSTGPWSMKALEQEKKIRSYVHTRLVHTALRLLAGGPISIGVTWYQSMFQVDAKGFIVFDPSTQVAGGHQVCVVGCDVEHQRIRVRNSWGTSWGQDGHAWLSWKAFDALMGDGGDVVQPVV